MVVLAKGVSHNSSMKLTKTDLLHIFADVIGVRGETIPGRNNVM